MKNFINKLLSIRYNEIVQCPTSGGITTTLVIGGNTPLGL